MSHPRRRKPFTRFGTFALGFKNANLRAVINAGALLALVTTGVVVTTNRDADLPEQPAIVRTADVVQSDGIWMGRHTVNGDIFVDNGGLHNFFESSVGDSRINGVTINAYFVDTDGAVSPTYTTVSRNINGTDGQYSLLMKPWVDAKGKTHTFDATPGEQLKVWAVAPDGYVVSFTESNPIGTSTQRDNAAWNLAAGANHVYNWRISLQKKPESWLSLPEPTTSNSTATQSGGFVSGNVFWDTAHSWGATAYPVYNPALGDKAAPKVEVRGSYVNDEVARQFDAWVDKNPDYTPAQFAAAQKQIMAAYEAQNPGKSAIAETVSGFTDSRGEYNLQFTGLWGNSYTNKGILDEAANGKWGTPATANSGSWLKGNRQSKHINTKYMYVYPVIGDNANYAQSSFQGPYFQNGNDAALVQGSNNGQDGLSPINFPLYPAKPHFDVLTYDTSTNPASPGDTATVKATGLVPNTTYTIRWEGSDGTKSETQLTTNSLGELSGAPLTVPANVSGSPTYTAYLVDPAGQDFGADSFAVIRSTVTSPWGSVGDDYKGTFSQSVPSGATVVYSATGLPDGLSIDPKTGAITGKPNSPGTYDVSLTARVTFPDGNTVDRTTHSAITITDAPAPPATAGKEYRETPAITGLPEGASVTGITNVTGLPAGLRWDPDAGKIVGTPTTAGPQDIKVTYTVKLADGSEATQTDTVSMTVEQGPLTDTNDPSYRDGTAVQGSTGSIPAPLNTDGSTLPAGTSFSSSTLPSWATLNPDGSITLAPGADVPAGTTTSEITVTYPDGTTDTVPVKLTVTAAPMTDSIDPDYADTAVQAGTATTVPAPTDAAGNALPDGTKYAASNLPQWATVNADGSISVSPARSVAEGPYTIPVTVTYPDGTQDSIDVVITVTQAAPTDADKYSPSYADSSGVPGSTVTVAQGGDVNVPAGATYAEATENPAVVVDPSTGELSITVDKDAVAGTVISGTIAVTYPDGTVDNVPYSFTVTAAPLDTVNDPDYSDATVQAGQKVIIAPPLNPDKTSTPRETTFELGPTAPDWVTIAKDGELTAQPGAEVTPGNYVIPVLVTYPDGTKDYIDAAVTVTGIPANTLNDPAYAPTEGQAGSQVSMPLIGDQKLPEGTTFKSDNPNFVVDPTTGEVTAHIPADAQPGDVITGTVTITYPDGTVDKAPLSAVVQTPPPDAAATHSPGYQPATGIPGSHVVLDQTGENEIPQGSTFSVDNPAFSVSEETGQLLYTVPADAQPGQVVTAKVTVTYPDGSTDEVIVSVTAIAAPQTDMAGEHSPSYVSGDVPAGSSTELPQVGDTSMPAGTTYTSDNDNFVVDPATGKVTVTAPSNATPGDVLTATITVTYPDGTTDKVPASVVVSPLPAQPQLQADEHSPAYLPGSSAPGRSVTMEQIGDADMPGGARYDISASTPPGVFTVDPVTGRVTATVGADSAPGDILSGAVTVTYPDGSTETVPVSIVVEQPAQTQADAHTPGYLQKTGAPNTSVVMTQIGDTNLPEGTKFATESENFSVDPQTGTVTATIAAGATPGDVLSGVITVTYPDGTSDNVPVDVTVIETPLTDAARNQPGYMPAQGDPGSTVRMEQLGDLLMPVGTKYTSDNPAVTVDPDTGEVTVKVPTDAKPGETITANVTVTYPDGSTEMIPVIVTVAAPAASQADQNAPGYLPMSGVAGSTQKAAQVGDTSMPEGTKYTSDNPAFTVDPKSGDVTARIPADAKPGDVITGLISVTYPDGSSEEVPVHLVVEETPATSTQADEFAPAYPSVETTAGSSAKVDLADGPALPEGTSFDTSSSGFSVDPKTGEVTVDVPADAKPGDVITGVITVTYPDGSTDTVPVAVVVQEQAEPNAPQADSHAPGYLSTGGEPGEKLTVDQVGDSALPAGSTFESDNPAFEVDPQTGKVTVTVPADAQPGEVLTATITVTYPDGSTDKVVVNITVEAPAASADDATAHAPAWAPAASAEPGDTVTLPNIGDKELPSGTTIESDDPQVTIDSSTGEVSVEVPSDAQPGETITTTITVTYPDGTKDTQDITITVLDPDAVSTTADEHTPAWTPGKAEPGEETTLTQVGDSALPAGSTFESDNPAFDVDPETGEVTVTVPANAQPGEVLTATITVTYPDGSIDEVPVSVTVQPSATTDASQITPGYVNGQAAPGTTLTIPNSGDEVPSGTSFEATGDGVTIDPSTGELTVDVPESARPGDVIEAEVTVTYPDGSTDKVVVSVVVTDPPVVPQTQAAENSPSYASGNGAPGQTVIIPQTGASSLPEGTMFTASDDSVTVDSRTGEVSVTVPADAKPGDVITGSVTVTYPDGSTDVVPVAVVVGQTPETQSQGHAPGYATGHAAPGASVAMPQVGAPSLPEGTKFESDNSAFKVDPITGDIVANVPDDATPGSAITGTITVTYPDGSKDIVPVSVVVDNPTVTDATDNTPGYLPGAGAPGKTLSIPQTGDTNMPSGTKFTTSSPNFSVDPDTGTVTAVIPADAKVGDVLTGNIEVTYPDGTREVVVSVVVTEEMLSDALANTPGYLPATGAPGQTIPMNQDGDVVMPEGSQYASDNPAFVVDPVTGQISVAVPSDAKPGDVLKATITVTYPDGSTDSIPVTLTVSPAPVAEAGLNQPGYLPGKGLPGSVVALEQTGDTTLPENTTFISEDPIVTVDPVTGRAELRVPADAVPGQIVTAKVTAIYPDGSRDTLPVSVVVDKPGATNVHTHTPGYAAGEGPADTFVLLEQQGDTNLPDGSTFSMDSETEGFSVDPETGVVTVKVPKKAQPGDILTALVKVTYPDGTSDVVPVTVRVSETPKPSDAAVNNPAYVPVQADPGEEVTVEQTGDNGLPPGTTFTSDSGSVKVDKETGKVTVSVPKDAKPGDVIEATITATYPDGTKDEATVTIIVTEPDVSSSQANQHTPAYVPQSGEPGKNVTLPVVLGEKEEPLPPETQFESDNPDTVMVAEDGTVTVKIPADAQPGTVIRGTVTVAYPDGTKDVVPVSVTVESPASQTDAEIHAPGYIPKEGAPGSTVKIPQEADFHLPKDLVWESDNPLVTVTNTETGDLQVNIPKDAKPGDVIEATITVTYPDGTKDTAPVKVVVSATPTPTPEDPDKPSSSLDQVVPWLPLIGGGGLLGGLIIDAVTPGGLIDLGSLPGLPGSSTPQGQTPHDPNPNTPSDVTQPGQEAQPGEPSNTPGDVTQPGQEAQPGKPSNTDAQDTQGGEDSADTRSGRGHLAATGVAGFNILVGTGLLAVLLGGVFLLVSRRRRGE
ncbi:Rib/alpha-like domain-containing protein [Corynebacterium aurimucosum]|uniref:Rib/alpha-like domain-containing protein n=1 Tax=Corynebacterium aurimucosum TaxID=169292 RepID=UPI0039909D0F